MAAWITVPGFAEIILSSAGRVLSLTYFMSVMWGIGGLTYGLGIGYLGMSLGNSVILGISTAFGALVPPIYYNFVPTEGKISFTDMLTNPVQLILFGVFLCLTGIAVSGKAGMMKELEISEEEKKKSVKDFSLVKGLIIAMISGLLSAFFNYGGYFGVMVQPVSVKQCHFERYCNYIKN